MSRVYPKKMAPKGLLATIVASSCLLCLTAQTPVVLTEADPRGPNFTGSEQATVLNNQYFFYGKTPAAGSELWVTDGSPAGTRMVKEINPGTANGPTGQALAVFDNRVWFQAQNPTVGTELWYSDGTETGTQAFDLAAGTASSTPLFLTAGKHYLYFCAYDQNNNFGVWRSDGTQAGTQAITNASTFGNAPPTQIKGLATMGDSVFIAINDALYLSDGTPIGTKLVKKVAGGRFGRYIEELTVIGNKLYFSGNDNTALFNFEPWVSDGTEAGTVMLKDITVGGGSNPKQFFRFKDKVYFAAGVSLLWRTDGTPEHTEQFLTNQVSESGVDQNIFASNGDFLYFQYKDPTASYELWRTDGTIPGSKLVKDLSPGPFPFYSKPRNFQFAAGKLYFSGAIDSSHELCVSDGTEAGTKRLADLAGSGGNGSHPHLIRQVGNKLVFIALLDPPKIFALDLTSGLAAAPDASIPLKVSPNPAATGHVTVAIPPDRDLQRAHLRLFDAAGHLAWESTVGDYTITIPLGSIAAGAYTLQYVEASGAFGLAPLLIL